MADLSLESKAVVIEIDMVEDVVEQQERKAPFEEGNVQPLHLFHAGLPTGSVVGCWPEEESRADEEEGDVE